MSIRAIIGFDHLEGLAQWQTLLDSGVSFVGGTSAYAVKDGYLGHSNVSTGQYGLAFDIANIIDPAATKYIVGMRVRCEIAGSLSDASGYVGLGFGGTGKIDSLGGAYAPLATAGNTLYLEMEVDLVTNTIRRWVNNVETTTSAVPAASAKLLRLNTGWGGYTGWRCSCRDVYILDDVVTGNDSNVSRLGPQLMVPIVSQSAVGVDWTANSGTLLSAVNPAPAELPVTNKVTSPVSRNPLTLGLSANIPAGAKINGVSLNLGGKSLATGPTLLGTKLVQGGSELAAKTVSLPMAQNYSGLMGVVAKAPDGADWTIAKVNATSLVITPDVSG